MKDLEIRLKNNPDSLVTMDQMCFIANSVNFKVHHEPVCKVAD
ncbi:hypothetical protein [Dyadobacter pollutisoli]|uniref:Uncharacterized protein n=1 Tax=Dyadobacter pollutisoli TaxID=2910158 RepID=A0A9E8NAU4_9BACT|nr:hypothetical protein [Dyadobacter pollutisoli]WAC10944.1 hypothetical protein ON006_24755 [Dyadobacter pollutisoli]